MQFNSSIKTISVTENARRIYQELNDIKPKEMSFSSFLAFVAEDYLINYTGNVPEKKETDIMSEDWYSVVNSCDEEELKKIQEALIKIQNLIDNRVRKQLC
jgi:predicted CopG family antitoxin